MNQAKPSSGISSGIAVAADGWMLWKFEEDDKVYTPEEWVKYGKISESP